jgi:glycosyltransferase involved in cell wall biosynthesis
MSKFRIAYICMSAPHEGRGAAYVHVHEIINGLSQLGFNVNLFEPAYAPQKVLPGAIGRLRGFIEIQLRLFKSKEKFDILYVRSHFAAFPIILWAKIFRKISVIQEINGPYEDLFTSWPGTRKFSIIFKWLIRIQMYLADALIAVTPQLKDWIAQEVGKKLVYTIPNAANTEIFNPYATTKHKLPESYVVWFGSMALWQGIETMLAAVEQPEWPDQVALVFIGEGTEESKVKYAALQNPKIVYLGRLPYTEIPGIVAGSLAGLIQTNKLNNRFQQGLSPLKIYETLACGVPAIVSDLPGQADLVRTHECGVVIPAENPQALAESVAFIYDNPAKRQEMGQRGREIVEKEHSWKQRAKDTAQIINKFIQVR